MARLLILILMVTLAFGNGSSIAAFCHHEGAREHMMALRSDQHRVAALAVGEEAAAASSAKKGTFLDSGSFSVAATLHPAPPMFRLPFKVRAIRPILANAPPLRGTSVLPLLRPPLR